MFYDGSRSQYKCPNTLPSSSGSSIWSVYFIPSVKGIKAEEDHKGFEGMLPCKKNDNSCKILNVYFSFQGEIVP